MLKKPIALVGMPGSGKSTIGKNLAEKLSCEFVDSDELIEQDAGCKISEIFEESGEPVFREMETNTISSVLNKKEAPYILSTGGGAIMTPAVYDMLNQMSVIVYLSLSVEELWSRLEKSYTHRPLLSQSEDHPKKRLEDLMQKRDATYRKAHVIINCDHKPLDSIVSEVIKEVTK